MPYQDDHPRRLTARVRSNTRAQRLNAALWALGIVALALLVLEVRGGDVDTREVSAGPLATTPTTRAALRSAGGLRGPNAMTVAPPARTEPEAPTPPGESATVPTVVAVDNGRPGGVRPQAGAQAPAPDPVPAPVPSGYAVIPVPAAPASAAPALPALPPTAPAPNPAVPSPTPILLPGIITPQPSPPQPTADSGGTTRSPLPVINGVNDALRSLLGG